MRDIIGLRGRFLITCRTKEGHRLWQKAIDNMVVNVGKQDLLDKYFSGSAYTAAWYIGLKNVGTIAAGNTAAAHSGWTEFTGYTESARPAYTPGGATISSPNASITNAGAAATFSFNASGTVAGLFVCSNSIKSGTSGLLFSAADFPGGAESVASGQVWDALYSLTC